MTVAQAITNNYHTTSAETITAAHKNGLLESRSVVPRKATGWLTDMQIRKIGLVALTVILAIGPVLAGVFSAGTGTVVLGAFYGMMGGVLGGLFGYLNWPRADYQTSKGAAIIRQDLKTKSLDDLHNYYTFDELAHYGYISKESANTMASMYNSMPKYSHIGENDRFSHRFGYPETELPRFEHSSIFYQAKINTGVYEKREKIEGQFNGLRNRKGYLLT